MRRNDFSLGQATVASAAGRGRSGEAATCRQRLARISAALSVGDRGSVKNIARETMGRQKLTIVCVVAFNEAPAVDVNDLTGLAVIAAEHVKATNHLAEALADTCGPFLLLFAQMCDETMLHARKPWLSHDPRSRSLMRRELTESPFLPYCAARHRRRTEICVSPRAYTLSLQCKP